MCKILRLSVLLTFFITSISVSGQYYDGGVSLTGLFTEENGYNAHLNYSHRVFNYFDFIDVGVQVNSSDLSFGDFDIPTTLVAFNAGFYYDLIRNNRRFFYRNAFALTIGGGVQIGQESFDFDEIRVLENAGSRYRIHDPSTWPEQAGLAHEGKWQELDEYQKFLNAGKR